MQDNIRKFLCGQFQNVENVKNNQYKNLGVSCATVMVGYMFDTLILNISGVYHNMWHPEDFVSDHFSLHFVRNRTIKMLL